MAGADSTFFTALAFAFGADDIASECEFSRFAFVKIFEGDVYSVNEILSFTRTLPITSTSEATAETSKELTKQIL